MKIEYKVRNFSATTYEVVQITKIFGSRTTSYDSQPDSVSETGVYHGDLCDCYAYIKLKEGKYM